MKPTLTARTLSIIMLLTSIGVANVQALCAGYTAYENVTVQRCSVPRGCGANSQLRLLEKAENCATWCCPDGILYYSEDCNFVNPKNQLGEPYCCPLGSPPGGAKAFRAPCPMNIE
jgi:hypothetical protein